MLLDEGGNQVAYWLSQPYETRAEAEQAVGDDVAGFTRHFPPSPFAEYPRSSGEMLTRLAALRLPLPKAAA